VEEIQIMALKYTIQLPPPGASDVVSREVTATVNADPPKTTALPGSALEVVELFQHGDNVSIVLVDVDGAGNRSQPSDPLGFTAADTFPPPKPGELAIGNVEQVP